MGIVQTTFSAETVRKWQLPTTIISIIFAMSMVSSVITATILKVLNNNITLVHPVVIWVIISAILFFGIELIYGDLLMSN